MAAVALLALVGCGSDGDRSGGASDVPTVVATTSIWADITANVACDGLAVVESVVPPGGDPHSFEPSLRDRETMQGAALVIANGLRLEESLADTIGAVESKGVPVLRVADGLDTIPIGAHGSGDDDHDEHGDRDPHVWWDPTRVAAAVPMIADALVEAGLDPARVAVCADQYVDDLSTLDDEVATIVAALPVDQRILVTNHDSLGYFADRYDFDVLGSVIPSSSSLAASSPAQLDELAARIVATGAPAIFADTQNSSADADALARRVGGVAVVSLLTDTLGKPDSDAGTYIGWLRGNAHTIVDALTSNEGS